MNEEAGSSSAPEAKSRMNGCLPIGLISLFLLLGLIGYCGIALYRVATEDIPKIRALTEQFVKSYNAEDYDAIYASADSEFQAAISKEKNADQASHVKDLTGSSILLGYQIGWKAQSSNGRKYITITYQGTSDKGKIILTMKYHLEAEWKLMAYHIDL